MDSSYLVLLLTSYSTELLYHQPPRLVGVRALAVSQPAGPASRATALFGLFAKKLLCKITIAPFLLSRNLPAPSSNSKQSCFKAWNWEIFNRGFFNENVKKTESRLVPKLWKTSRLILAPLWIHLVPDFLPKVEEMTQGKKLKSRFWLKSRLDFSWKSAILMEETNARLVPKL